MFRLRRRLLAVPFTVTILGHARALFAAGARSKNASTDPLASLGAFLDTLLPADESPSATQLGVEEHIRAQGARDASFGRLLEHGCRWLDEQAQRDGAVSFNGANESLRIVIVSRAAEARPRTAPRLFFEYLQSDAFHYYYADPASHTGLGFSGPPQPAGYAHFDRPMGDA